MSSMKIPSTGQKSSVSSDLIGSILGNPQIQETLVQSLLGALLGLFKRKPKPIVLPGGTPVPNPNNDAGDDFPDDVIPPPVTAKTRIVSKVRMVASRLQYSRRLNPEMYTADNKFGLYSNPRLYEGGKDAINIEAKGWFDLTAFDQNGVEFKPEAVAEYDLAYKTEHHVGDTFIKGNGGSLGSPNEGYETFEGEGVGNGITAWISSNGFLHQVKFHKEGTYEVWGKVGGVESNRFVIRVD